MNEIQSPTLPNVANVTDAASDTHALTCIIAAWRYAIAICEAQYGLRLALANTQSGRDADDAICAHARALDLAQRSYAAAVVAADKVRNAARS